MAAIEMVGDRLGADLVCYFNNQPFHSPPVGLGLANLAIVRATTMNNAVNINTYNHPLPRTDTEKVIILTITLCKI